jgi:hypothetical protein
MVLNLRSVGFISMSLRMLRSCFMLKGVEEIAELAFRKINVSRAETDGASLLRLRRRCQFVAAEVMRL